MAQSKLERLVLAADQAVRSHYIGKSVRRYFAEGGLVFNKYGPKV
jgi:hypothetical protein